VRTDFLPKGTLGRQAIKNAAPLFQLVTERGGGGS